MPPATPVEPAAALRTGPWFILGAAVLWSTSGAAMKMTALSGWQVSFGRSLVAAGVFALLFRKARVRPDSKVAWVSLAYALTVLLYALANKRTTAANAIFLQDTAPLYVLLFSAFFLKQRPKRGELWAVPLFILGLSLFFLDQLTPGQFEGNLLALGSGVAFAACILGLRELETRNVSALLYGNLLSAALALPLVFHGPRPSSNDLLWLVYLGLFQLGLAYALFARGLQTTPAVEASLLALLEPVLNPVWTYLVTGEGVGPWAMAGGAVILVATLWRILAPAQVLSAPVPARAEG